MGTGTNGRWRKGQSGNPAGRPKRVKEAEYLRLLNQQVTATCWVRIIDKAIKQALEGDAKAREWLSRYLLPSAEQLRAAGMPEEITFLDDLLRNARREETESELMV